MKMAFDKYKFSARTYNKILKVSRTIADLNGKENICDEHLLEALRYRTLNNKYWGVMEVKEYTERDVLIWLNSIGITNNIIDRLYEIFF